MWIALLLGCGHPSMNKTATTCQDCHPGAVADWSTSRHATANTTPAFEEAYRRAQDPWCLTCHIPSSGVDCQVCHATASQCVDCHQFDLPGTTVASQNTGHEHSASFFSDRTCASCHDPHSVPGAYDGQRVRKALEVTVRATEAGTIATFTTTDVGHAMPTGDPFRRLVLDLCADLSCTEVTANHTLHRALHETPSGWEERTDTRIPPPVNRPTSTLTVPLPPARGWRLWYRYTDPRHTALRSTQLLVDAGPVLPARTAP